MPRLIENALAHFSSKDLRKIEVPEWEVTLFAKNLTLDDKVSLRKKVDPDIVTRLATFALTAGSESEEDREKNL